MRGLNCWNSSTSGHACLLWLMVTWWREREGGRERGKGKREGSYTRFEREDLPLISDHWFVVKPCRVDDSGGWGLWFLLLSTYP